MKTLKQIQEENRKTIIIDKPLTLNRVLIALQDIDYWMEPWNNFISFSYQDKSGIAVELFKWDLTKETLEEQSEETQRAINKLNNK